MMEYLIKNTETWSTSKFNVYPVIKLLGLVLLNILAFTSLFQDYRIIIFILTVILALIVKIQWYEIRGVIKFLSLNFVGLYLLFYFISFDWYLTLLIFFDYALSILIMFLGSFIFYKTTPPKELLIIFEQFHLPPKLSIAIIVSINIIPLLALKVREIIAFQEARGFKMRFYKIRPIFIPTLLFLLDYSVNLAVSLESRGFNT